jgi:hypothetical protein
MQSTLIRKKAPPKPRVEKVYFGSNAYPKHGPTGRILEGDFKGQTGLILRNLPECVTICCSAGVLVLPPWMVQV